MGYSTQSKGYKLLDEKTSTVIICRDVIFNEKDFGDNKLKVVEAHQQKSMEFDNGSEEGVGSRDIEPESEEVGECRHRRYPAEQQRYPPTILE